MKERSKSAVKTELKTSPVSAFTEKDFEMYRKTDRKSENRQTYRKCRESSNGQSPPSSNNAKNSSKHEKKLEKAGQPEAGDKITIYAPIDDTIFAAPPPINYKQLATEAIRSDCHKHGYLVENTIGEGAYAKVKLAEVTPQKMLRIPDMAEYADYEGTLKVSDAT